jgi:hypothetical protein
MSAWKEGVLRLCSLTVLVLASINLWGVHIHPAGVSIALNVVAFLYITATLVEWIGE